MSWSVDFVAMEKHLADAELDKIAYMPSVVRASISSAVSELDVSDGSAVHVVTSGHCDKWHASWSASIGRVQVKMAQTMAAATSTDQILPPPNPPTE